MRKTHFSAARHRHHSIDANASEDLHTLDLSETQVTDKGLRELARMDNLRHLNVSDSRVTGEAVRALRKALPKAKILRD